MINLKENEKLCPRCRGAKEMYQIGGGYTSMNTGGKRAKCPSCNGDGKIKTLEAALADLTSLNSMELKSESVTNCNPLESEIVSHETIVPPKNKGGRPKKAQLPVEL